MEEFFSFENSDVILYWFSFSFYCCRGLTGVVSIIKILVHYFLFLVVSQGDKKDSLKPQIKMIVPESGGLTNAEFILVFVIDILIFKNSCGLYSFFLYRCFFTFL